MSSLKKDIELFQKQFPDNFGSVEVDGRSMHFVWSGDKTKIPLVLVHGSPGSWEGWAKFLLNSELQKKYFVIAVDRLGYGKSGSGQTEPALDKQANAILQVLRANAKHSKAILVGHSFGGPVIASAAMLDPTKIAGLVFVAASVSPELEETKWFQYPASWWPIRHLIPTELKVCNEEIRPLKSELQSQSNRWPLIKARVAVIQGNEDRLVPKENADYLQQRLPSRTIVFFEKVEKLSHFIPWERPDLILRAIESVNPNGNSI